ncbi:hypothetical protein BD626DRAFT_514210, partial [Schizophyllum amplum]
HPRRPSVCEPVARVYASPSRRSFTSCIARRALVASPVQHTATSGSTRPPQAAHGHLRQHSASSSSGRRIVHQPHRA